MIRIILEETNEAIQHKVEIETMAVEIGAVLEEIRLALIAYGFHPNSIKEAILELAEDYDISNEELAHPEEEKGGRIMIPYPKIQGLYKRYLYGDKKGKFIMGHYSLPEFELLKDIEWEWTEKVDGTNIRVQIYTDPLIKEIEFKGKTDKAEIPKHLLEYLQKTFIKDKIFSIFEASEENPDICLYGEGYGYKIQKNGGKYFAIPEEVGFILFDIKIGNFWLKREDLLKIANNLDIELVPIIKHGTINEAIEYVKSEPKSIFGNRDFIMEGLVLRPIYELRDRRGHRIITKIKYKDTCELLSCDDIRELLYHFLPKRAVATDEVLRQMEIGYRLLKYTILNFHKQKFRKSD